MRSESVVVNNVALKGVGGVMLSNKFLNVMLLKEMEGECEFATSD